MRKRSDLFISDCAEFVAIRMKWGSVPNEGHHWDVVRVDGSEFWHGTRYANDRRGLLVPFSVLLEELDGIDMRPERFVGGWSNRYQPGRSGAYTKEGFVLHLYSRDTDERHSPEFHRALTSLAPHHKTVTRG